MLKKIFPYVAAMAVLMAPGVSLAEQATPEENPPQITEETFKGKALEYMDSIEGAVSQFVSDHGQDAMDLALLYARIDAASELLLPLVAFTGLTILLGVMWYKIDKYVSRPGGDMEELTFPTVVLVFALIPYSAAFCGLMNIWAWAGLFYPEVWIAHRAIEAVLN